MTRTRTSRPYLIPLTSMMLTTTLGVLLASGCGTPDYCADQGPKGFDTFRNKEWSPYCEKLESRLNDPLGYELTELTDLFSSYPDRAEEMKKQLASYEEPERCFESKRDQLELRRLESCLEEDADKESRILKAWAIRAEPWLEDYEKKVKKLRVELNTVSLEAQRIEEKVSQKFDMSAPMDARLVEDMGNKLNDLQPKINTIDKAKLDYERFVSTSLSYPALSSYIEDNYADAIQAILKEHEDNRFAIAKLRGSERFFQFAVNTVGRKCIEGPRARKEDKIARKILSSEMKKSKAGKTIHVNQKITSATDPKTSAEVESIKGFYCGERAPENQFEGRNRLCAQQHFTLTRTRPAGQRRFGDWQIEELKEGELTEGVDCALLER